MGLMLELDGLNEIVKIYCSGWSTMDITCLIHHCRNSCWRGWRKERWGLCNGINERMHLFSENQVSWLLAIVLCVLNWIEKFLVTDFLQCVSKLQTHLW